MAEAHRDRISDPADRPLPGFHHGGAALLRVALAMAAAGFALHFEPSLHIDPLGLAVLVVVLAAAGALGSPWAMASALTGGAFYLVAGGRLPPPDLRSHETLDLALFAFATALVGLYTDEARRREGQPPPNLERPPAGPGMLEPFRQAGHTLLRQFGVASPVAVSSGFAAVGLALRRLFTTLYIGGAGLTAALALHDALGPVDATLLTLAGVLIIAGLMGARFGLVTGLALGLALVSYQNRLFHDAPPGAAGLLVILAFAAAGSGVGRLSDRARQDREALKLVVGASREMAAQTDELAHRRVLFDNLRRIMPVGDVLIFDGQGVELGAGETRPQRASTGRPGEWRSRRLSAEGRDVGHVRWRYPGADAHEQIVDQIAAALIDLGASAIVRARLSAERAEMADQTRAEQMRIILLDAVSHHFRSPLAGILGSVTSILNLPEQHDRNLRRQLLQIIREQANRLNRYVETFLSLARLESGQLDINLSRLNLDALIYDVWESFGEAGGSRRYLHVDLGQEPIVSDSSLLIQIFGNILENAIKYSPDESVVKVQGRREAGALVIQVIDQGSGVSEVGLKRMFDRFYRSQGSRAPGLGLGLYITRSLVEMLGGSVTAANRSDGWSGLVVTVTLPLTEGP